MLEETRSNFITARKAILLDLVNYPTKGGPLQLRITYNQQVQITILCYLYLYYGNYCFISSKKYQI